jgi:uncharacterized membrane protein
MTCSIPAETAKIENRIVGLATNIFPTDDWVIGVTPKCLVRFYLTNINAAMRGSHEFQQNLVQCVVECIAAAKSQQETTREMIIHFISVSIVKIIVNLK